MRVFKSDQITKERENMNITPANRTQNTTFGAVKVNKKIAENLISGTIFEKSTAQDYIEDIVKQTESEAHLNTICRDLHSNAIELQKKLPENYTIILNLKEITKIENQKNTSKKIILLESFMDSAKLATINQLERIQKAIAPLKKDLDHTQKKITSKIDSFLNEVENKNQKIKLQNKRKKL